jgi:uncharacterized protein YeaO (DUF488 family)
MASRSKLQNAHDIHIKKQIYSRQKKSLLHTGTNFHSDTGRPGDSIDAWPEKRRYADSGPRKRYESEREAYNEIPEKYHEEINETRRRMVRYSDQYAYLLRWLDFSRVVLKIPFSLTEVAKKRFIESGEDYGFLLFAIKSMDKKISGFIRPMDVSANDDDIRVHAKNLSCKYQSICNVLGPNGGLSAAESALGYTVDGKTIESRIKRITCDKYWRRQIRKNIRPYRELWHILLAPHYIKYASTDAIKEYQSMVYNHKIWSDMHEMVSQEGTTVPLPSPEEHAKHRHAQLTAISKGIESLAAEAGMTSRIITLTLDSDYHPTTTMKNGKIVSRMPNIFYDSLKTPRVGHAFMNLRWRRMRSAFQRKGIVTYWILGVHPNKDETVHWHIVLWSHAKDAKMINALFYRYFKTNDNDKQIVIEQTHSAAGASSYAMRMLAYITRQTKTINTGSSEKEETRAAEAEAATAWASTWNIRRYRTSHSAATLWKLARKPDVEAPSDMKAAAKIGDFYTFYKLKNHYKTVVLYHDKINSYGDEYRCPAGISYVMPDTRKTVEAWKQISWTLHLKGAEIENQKGECIQSEYSYIKEPSNSIGEHMVAALDVEIMTNTHPPPDRWAKLKALIECQEDEREKETQKKQSPGI